MSVDDVLVLEERPTAQLIAAYLRDQIIDGNFRPGQQINESTVAVNLRTSRGPLREALQRLCQEGLLVSQRNRGVFVRELTPEDVKEVYFAREAIEMAAAKSLLDGPEEHLKKTCKVLNGIIRAMAKQAAKSDWQSIARADLEFHKAFVAGAKNSRLNKIYETLAAESIMCIMNLEISHPRAKAIVHPHQNIADLLEAKDKDGLLAAIKEHMEHPEGPYA
jgi:DNA-binding GntR family transcriptional regulator